jgi:hypothetical protein
MHARSTPLLLLPFELLFKFVFRLIAAVLGLALMIAGGVLCITIIGAAVGIPLGAFGFALMIKGFFRV